MSGMPDAVLRVVPHWGPRRWTHKGMTLQGVMGLFLLLPLLASCLNGGSSARSSGSFQNPVYTANFPDPFVLKAGKTYYAYATNGATGNVPTITSRDLVHWTPLKDAMPRLPAWVLSDVWAPEVLHRGDGRYVLYFAGRETNSGHQCIGDAIGSSPAGPFTATSKHPFICQTQQCGDIDPDAFRDASGQLYFYWKDDGNACGALVHIYVRKLSPDGMRLLGKTGIVETANDLWEGSVTEAPTMWKQGGKYYLFYSGGPYDQASYSVGYASCKGPLGPCKDAPENPILTSRCKAAGPGGQSIIADAKGQTWMVYHAWPSGSIGPSAAGPGRQLWIDRLDWKNGKPVVHGPTCKPQPAPAT